MNNRRETGTTQGRSLVTQMVPGQRTAQKPQERRSGVRYGLHARVVFTWHDLTGAPRESRGHTRDVAQKGTFIVSPDCPPKGAAVMLNIFLPVNAGEKRMLRMDADGNVTRAERPVGQPFLNGFAVSHRRMNLFGG